MESLAFRWSKHGAYWQTGKHIDSALVLKKDGRVLEKASEKTDRCLGVHW